MLLFLFKWLTSHLLQSFAPRWSRICTPSGQVPAHTRFTRTNVSVHGLLSAVD
jgi:hypothetical protein